MVHLEISQRYLEGGVNFARHEIQKRRLMYLKYILDKKEDSTFKRFYYFNLNFQQRETGHQSVNLIYMNWA